MTIPTEIHFDVDRITSIKIRDKYKSHYRWKDERKEVKTFFGLITKVKHRESGYYDGSYHEYSSYYETPYTEQELIGLGYIVEGKNVYNKPYLEIRFKSGDSIGQNFNTFSEATVYALKIKKLSGKTFEIIKFI